MSDLSAMTAKLWGEDIGVGEFNAAEVAGKLEKLGFTVNTCADEFEIYGWMMWDGDDPKGFDDAFFVPGNENPIDQESKIGDWQGHIWKSFPLYKKSIKQA